MKYKYKTVFIIERSVKSFEEKIGALTGQGYYINGALVVKKYIKSFFPFRLGNEYYVLMSRSETYEEIEKEN